MPWTNSPHALIFMIVKKKEFLISLGENIKCYRKETGLSQESFAYKVGLDRSYYGSIERGERNISIITLLKISTALEVNINSLIPTK